MLDPRRLRLLIQLESLGTVRAVAQAASMSPSAVSQQLQALERESGASLLERHGRTVALTDAGVALAGHARVILERIDAAEEALRALQDAPAGAVRVSAFTSAMRAFVIDAAKLVGEFGGSLSGEHGDGRARSELLPHMYSPDAIALFGDRIPAVG